MKYDVIGLMRQSALALKNTGDAGYGYALAEASNNLLQVM